mmetsp:Transcript_31024/g.41135  ORF Transcript_31024/g.41135 Transcript_31024/m.41135 type:complete len:80 (-) Transcript_31024:3713-3952(-)
MCGCENIGASLPGALALGLMQHLKKAKKPPPLRADLEPDGFLRESLCSMMLFCDSIIFISFSSLLRLTMEAFRFICGSC